MTSKNAIELVLSAGMGGGEGIIRLVIVNGLFRFRVAHIKDILSGRFVFPLEFYISDMVYVANLSRESTNAQLLLIPTE